MTPHSLQTGVRHPAKGKRYRLQGASVSSLQRHCGDGIEAISRFLCPNSSYPGPLLLRPSPAGGQEDTNSHQVKALSFLYEELRKLARGVSKAVQMVPGRLLFLHLMNVSPHSNAITC